MVFKLYGEGHKWTSQDSPYNQLKKTTKTHGWKKIVWR